MKVRFSPTAIVLPILSCALLAALWTSCSSAPPVPTTRVDGSTVSLAQKYSDRDSGEYTITITPPNTPPAGGVASASASTQPAEPIHIISDGKDITAPAGSAVTVHSSMPGSTNVEASADAVGSTLVTQGDKGTFDSKPPEVSLDGQAIHGTGGRGTKGGGGAAAGGQIDVSWTALLAQVSAASSTAKWMMGLGCLVLLLGWIGCAIYSWMTDRMQWLSIAIVTVIGVAVIGTAVILDTHPVYFVLALLAGGVALIWHFYHKLATGQPPAASTAPQTGTPTPTNPSAAGGP